MSWVSGGQSSPAGLTGATAASRYAGSTTGGAPASGTFAVGDFIVDQLGMIWVCITAGSPGTWVAGQRIFSFGTSVTENTDPSQWTPAYYGYSAWNYEPGLASVGTASSTQIAWAYRVFCPRAFTLTKVAVQVTTAGGTLTAANSTTVAAGSNAVDVTSYAGAGTLNVAATAGFAATGTLLVATASAPAGFAWMSYTGTSGGNAFTGVTTLQSGTGTLATGGAVTQSLNTLGVFNNAGTTMHGILPDQVANWGSSGVSNQSLTIPNATSAAISANTYIWVVQLGTGTTPVALNGTVASPVKVNQGLAAAALRVGRVATGQTSFPATITPGSLVSTGTNPPGNSWVAVT